MQISRINHLIEESENMIYLIVTSKSLRDKTNHKNIYNIFKQITNLLKDCNNQMAVNEFRNNILSLNKYNDEMVRIRLYRIILYILYLDLNEYNINHGFVQKMFSVFRSDNEQYGGGIDELTDRLLNRLKSLKSIVSETQLIFPKINHILNSIKVNNIDYNVIQVKIILS